MCIYIQTRHAREYMILLCLLVPSHPLAVISVNLLLKCPNLYAVLSFNLWLYIFLLCKTQCFFLYHSAYLSPANTQYKHFLVGEGLPSLSPWKTSRCYFLEAFFVLDLWQRALWFWGVFNLVPSPVKWSLYIDKEIKEVMLT